MLHYICHTDHPFYVFIKASETTLYLDYARNQYDKANGVLFLTYEINMIKTKNFNESVQLCLFMNISRTPMTKVMGVLEIFINKENAS